MRRLAAPVLFALFVLVCAAPRANANTIIIDFRDGSGGTTTLSGTTWTGSNITVGELAVSYDGGGTFTPYAISNGTLNFTLTGCVTGTCTGGSATITGSVPSLSVGSTTLLAATFTSGQYFTFGTQTTIGGFGTDTKSLALLSALGIPANAVWTLNGFTTVVNSSHSATSVDFSNSTDVVPEPASLMLFGTGLSGLGLAIKRRRDRASKRQSN